MPKQTAKQGDTNWHVKPVTFRVAGPDLKDHEHENHQGRTDNPARRSTAHPENNGRTDLEERAEAKGQPAASVEKDRGPGS
jgi:hypothetical protein